MLFELAFRFQSTCYFCCTLRAATCDSMGACANRHAMSNRRAAEAMRVGKLSTWAGYGTCRVTCRHDEISAAHTLGEPTRGEDHGVFFLSAGESVMPGKLGPDKTWG